MGDGECVRVYLLFERPLQGVHLHLLFSQAGVQCHALCVGLSSHLSYFLIRSAKTNAGQRSFNCAKYSE